MDRLQYVIDIATDPQSPNAMVTILRLAKELRLDLGTAACDVLAERRRQIAVEGYSPDHDDDHANDEIAAMACYYAMPPGAREWPASHMGYGETLGEAIVPEGWVPKQCERRQELVKAGALILAEIERLARAPADSEARTQTP